jgi:hypothetical protein
VIRGKDVVNGRHIVLPLIAAITSNWLMAAEL